ncbi:MAG: sulfate ABC transporter substrate-binding protein [Thermogutta sp.]|nr:sulfate ABC transporter substrate-binding protein [Thermogutta sp.]
MERSGAVGRHQVGCSRIGGSARLCKDAPTGLRLGCGLGLLALSLVVGCGKSENAVTLLNVSYDPTRELYQEINGIFAERILKETGVRVEIRQSHGGSGKQTRAVIDGLEADVVTLAVASDIDAIAELRGWIRRDWQRQLPNNSCPYTSTIVFLVRKGNPKGIRDWDDLAREDVEVVTPNPKTSGGARWNYLAAWGYALKRSLGSWDKLRDPAAKEEVAQAQKDAQAFVKRIFGRVSVMDTGARAATNTFVQRGIGDVLIAWENEALLAVKELGADRLEMVLPSVSILAEPPVAVVDAVVDRRGTRKLAEAYLKFLYEPEAQRIIAKHYFRPSNPAVAEECRERFPGLERFTVEEVFGGWGRAKKEHFDDGGSFDQIMNAKP